MKGLKEAILEESKRFEEFYHWLEKAMEPEFFREVVPEEISLIVHSLMGFKVQEYFSEIHLKNGAITLILDSLDADIKILENFSLYGIKNYTTYISQIPFPETSSLLRVAVLEFTSPDLEKKEGLTAKKCTELLNALPASVSKETAKLLLDKIEVKFLNNLPFDRQVVALDKVVRAEKEDLCQYDLQENEKMHLILAWKNTPKHNFLYRLAHVVYNHDLAMERVNATYLDPYESHGIFLLSLTLKKLKKESDVKDFLLELVTLKYFGSLDIFEKTFVSQRRISGNLANLLRTMRYFIHQNLVSIDPNLYSLEHIEEGLCRHPELTILLLNAFEAKFHPEKANIEEYQKIRLTFLGLVKALDTGDENLDMRRKNTLLQGMNFVDFVLKTNFYKENKSSLAFRLDPKYLDEIPFDRQAIFPALPFGIFFIKGMHFFGYHIRFKDLARGGLRTVFPPTKEKVESEINSVFQECYNLAYTQHKKNKDIPEGGAKGVILLKPNERLEEESKIYAWELKAAGIAKIEEKIEEYKRKEKLAYLYETQASFVRSFLSLVNCDERGVLRSSRIVDYYKKPEYIYLGPDENLHDSMIEWIAHESIKENYRPKGAFISGKPKLGINHKEYGVTSLGVNVFMHEVLNYLNIDPHKESFTVKMTGGPDGDVAGNQIFNLYRYYPNTAKLIALTDVSGTINDIHGLDLKECVRLFKEGKSIRHYNPEKLSSEGFLLDKETKKETTPYTLETLLWKNGKGGVIQEWLSGNEMNALYRHNVHLAKADIFIPCGGRPRTLRDTNCHEFLDDSFNPTAKAIVEGANLYLTPWARRFLEEKGVLVIKDSSANKGGVITSSFEILAGLTLSDDEFLKNKDELVSEILKRVEKCALDEAKLMLRTYDETKKYLTDISEEISSRINQYTDLLLDHLQTISLSNDPKDPFTKILFQYAPKVLSEKFGQKLLTIPDNHKKAIIATSIASQVVYKKGLDWTPSILEVLPLILQELINSH